MPLSDDDVALMKQVFKDLPILEKKNNLKKSEFIRRLSVEIGELLGRGYTYEMVAELLKKNNFYVSERTIRTTLLDMQKGKSKAKYKRPKKAANPESSTEVNATAKVKTSD